ncbi:hypothetical protein [Acinetobacter sp. 2JN-4]|uniref:hypothetical protein n=1 Tax=Acinetobacter sp. 2JN-4 TaxID=2479844 RepID=UPI0011C3D49B|nr:hypothetical protein [Acinetobacter sp. 2JN-4]
MIEINPYELDPEEARHQFYDYQERIFRKIHSEMDDVQDDITYILYHHYHPKNFNNIDPDVLKFLEKHGLKRSLKGRETDKANPDYYLAAYFGMETAENFFNNSVNMDFDTQLSNLSYAKNQLAILKVLSPTGEPKHKSRNKTGQSKGAKIANKNRYALTRQRAEVEWNKFKRTVLDWVKFKNNLEQYEKEINTTLKEFEQSFFNTLTGMRLKGSSAETKNLLDEKYTDSVQNPPLVIGWIRELEELPNKQKEQADKKRKQRRIDKMMENSPYAPLGIQLRREKNKILKEIN